MDKLIDQLYEVLYHTENEAAYQIVVNAIDYLREVELSEGSRDHD